MMLEDKVVIVTGGGRGIGQAIAKMAASRGAKLVINDYGVSTTGENPETGPAVDTVAQIREAGGDAVANTESVAESAAAARIVEQALDQYGRVDYLVNNAGILRDRIFHRMTEEEWDAVIGVHLKGSFNMAHAVAPHFRKQESGAFLHMTSTSGLIGNYGQANYAAAKMGLVGLSTALALDMSRYNVRSNCIAPFAWSRMIGTIPVTSPEQQARMERLQEMTPDKIAPLAVFLGSDGAQDVSGQIFCVRNNEIFLMSLPRPLRSLHRGEGWSPEAIQDQLVPAFAPSFYPLVTSNDIFSWDPV